MKKIKNLKRLPALFFAFSLFFFSCDNGNSNKDFKDSNKKIISDSFFWGSWVRMDTGDQYEFLEDSIKTSSKSYSIKEATSNSLSADELGLFIKQSDSVILNGAIPYFRKGGSNLEYSLKLVGFANSFSDKTRAISNLNGKISGLKGTGTSSTFSSWKSENVSGEDGIIKLKAPTINDVQTVTLNLDDQDDSLIVIPDIVVSNSGDNMGTVAIVNKDQYNLKITGTVTNKHNGYMYGNNAKTYQMTLSITNISQNECVSSVCTIKPADSRLTLSSTENIEAFTISTLPKDAKKELKIQLSFGEMEEAYIDTGINITIKNSKSNLEWVDYVPLRFFKGLTPITVAAKSPETEDKVSLNGFIIYPDGNNQFFTVKDSTSKTLLVPSFGEEKNYMMVFSGATVTKNLSESTEMYYSVAPGTSNEKVINLKQSEQTLLDYMNFGGDNQTEDRAYPANSDFIGYLSRGERDFYTIKADSNEIIKPEEKKFVKVSYVTSQGTAPEAIFLEQGTFLTISELTPISAENLTFSGWYLGKEKIEAGYQLDSNITLSAGWKEFEELNDGFVFIEGGTYTFGSSPDDENYYSDAKEVSVKSFYISPYELTQGEYEKYCRYTDKKYGSEPSLDKGKGENHPVYFVSWYDAIIYCNLRSLAEGLTPCYSYEGKSDPKEWIDVEALDGKYSCTISNIPSSGNRGNSDLDNVKCNFSADGYRLPTVEEWEFAAKGGIRSQNYIYAGSDNLDEIAWYDYRRGYYKEDLMTHEVGKKLPNELGLYDMSGNVEEWCWNLSGSSYLHYRDYRGGSYYDGVDSSLHPLRPVYRSEQLPYCRGETIGFRLARSATSSK